MCEFKAKVILTDIEGTTTSISFVKDVLFPYAKEHTISYLNETWTETGTQDLIAQLKNLPEYEKYLAESGELEDKNNAQLVANFVNYIIEKDLKLGPLKTLQGLVWAKGYADGDLNGHVYDDVPYAFNRWQAAGLHIAIYSSGSVQAQKLLFGQTTKGDLTPYLSGYFDTAIGHKQEQQSYVNIAQELQVDCGQVLFLTDVVQEAAAAHAAGMQTVVLKRPGNAPLSAFDEEKFHVINTFKELHVTLA